MSLFYRNNWKPEQNLWKTPVKDFSFDKVASIHSTFLSKIETLQRLSSWTATGIEPTTT